MQEKDPYSDTGEWILDNYRDTRQPPGTLRSLSTQTGSGLGPCKEGNGSPYQEDTKYDALNQEQQRSLILKGSFSIIYALVGKEKAQTLSQIRKSTNMDESRIMELMIPLISGNYAGAGGNSVGGHSRFNSTDLASKVKDEHRKLEENGETVVEDGNLTSVAREIEVLSEISDYLARYYKWI